MSAEYLPGNPSKTLVRNVRRTLAMYGVKVDRNRGEAWRTAWDWAAAVSRSYVLSSRQRWPPASEIASQFLLCVLVDMRADAMLRLPYRAGECTPERVRAQLAAGAMLKCNQHAPPLAGLLGGVSGAPAAAAPARAARTPRKKLCQRNDGPAGELAKQAELFGGNPGDFP